MAKKYEACFADEVPEGGRKIVDVGGRSVGIFQVDNGFYAVRNSCPHRGAPLCKGAIDGYVTGERPGEFTFERNGEILRCPWHGWEFDLKTGEFVFNPHKIWVRKYDVSIEQPVEDDPGIETYEVSVETPVDQPRPVLFVHL